MICVYAPDCNDFSQNGLGSVCPQSCIVTETLNGEYELTMVHPLDQDGKWKWLTIGRILRAPVPSGITPQVHLVEQPDDMIKIYRLTANCELHSGIGSRYKVLQKCKKDSLVILLRKTNETWYEVTCQDGKRGYLESRYLSYEKSIREPAEVTGEIIESRHLRDQPFRIYRTIPELDKITIYARHIFYDLLDHMIEPCKPSPTTAGATVVAHIANTCRTEHDFQFWSNLDTTADGVELGDINPVEAILGEDGVTKKYNSELQRDWYDVFIVKRIGKDTDIRISQGKNLLGIRYDIDVTQVCTRIMPTGVDLNGKTLYLPELFVDSPHLAQYPHPKWCHLPVNSAEESDSGEKKKNKAQCYQEMRAAAQAEFDAGCDLPIVTLSVDFINCADTVEYQSYAPLQNIFLGDRVSVYAPGIGVSVSMRMVQYTYDCLSRRYTQMELGSTDTTLSDTMISPSQIPSGSVTSSKLSGGSIGSLQLRADTIQTRHISAESITTEKLSSNSVNAEKIAAAAITAGHLAANCVDAQALAAVTAKVGSLTAQDVETDHLAAALAAFMVITAGTASFDQATVTHLVAEALNLSFGVGDQVWIRNLKVAYAQMVDAAISNLCIQASDGLYYRLDVGDDSQITAVPVTVSGSEVLAGQTENGQVILETHISAENLSTGDLLATYALINQIDAAKIDVDSLFAREAFIRKLCTSEIVAGKSLTIIADETEAAQSTAEGAATLAAQAYEIVDPMKAWLAFSAEGMRVGISGSNYTTLTDHTGFHILQGGSRIGSFAKRQLNAERVRIGESDTSEGRLVIRVAPDGGIAITGEED